MSTLENSDVNVNNLAETVLSSNNFSSSQKIGIVIAGLLAVWYLYNVGLVVYQCYVLRKFKGPLPLPVVGNVYEAGVLTFLKHLSKLRKKYGKIFSFIVFSDHMLVVTDPVVIRRVLSDPKAFPKGDDYTVYFHLGFGDSLVTANGEKHKHDRQVFGKYFIKSYISKFLPTCNIIASQAIDNLTAANASKPEISVNIEEFFATLALRTFGLFAMGIDYRNDPEREKYICHLVSKGSLYLGMIILIRPQKWLWSIIPQINFIKSARQDFFDELEKYHGERVKLIEKNEAPDDCFTAMIQANMPRAEMVDHFITLLSAGHDTTAFFSSYLALLLAQNPSAQQKLYEEIIRVLGDRTEVTSEDYSEMHYLQQCMQETLRLYAIIPNIARVSETDTHIKEAGITIPKGVKLLIPMFLINRDPDLWDNPSDFIPERFAGKSSAEFTSAKNGFFPFGYGTRTCIGNTLAQLEAAIFFCHILRKYRIAEEPGFKPIIMSGISLTTSNGIHVILIPR